MEGKKEGSVAYGKVRDGVYTPRRETGRYVVEKIVG